MKWTSIRGVITLAAFASVGCGASGPAFQKVVIPEGKSVIYAYRSSSIFGAAIQPVVNCGTDGVSLARSGYHPFVVESGTVTCSASTESRSEVRVQAKPNDEAYVKERIGMGFFVGRPHLEVIDKPTGAQEIESCRMQQ